MRVRIKICGITNLEDGLAAIDAGADALGFVFCEGSPRYLAPSAAGEVIRQLPPFAVKVGVFANPTESFVRETMEASGVDRLQFHGEESPEFCGQFRSEIVIKAFRVRDRESLERLAAYHSSAWLLDSFVPGQLGGTGAVFNWDLAEAANRLGNPILLAGGLVPENVAEAVRRVRPYAVDVSSGVESRPGRKDHAKVRAFIDAARQAGQALRRD